MLYSYIIFGLISVAIYIGRKSHSNTKDHDGTADAVDIVMSTLLYGPLVFLGWPVYLLFILIDRKK